MRIHLDLSRHCVETELRRQHERAVAQALRHAAAPGPSAALAETRLALLRSALEGLDFPRLRSERPALNAESRAAVALEISEPPRRIQLRVDGETAAEAPLQEAP